jgi:hypothetical protein
VIGSHCNEFLLSPTSGIFICIVDFLNTENEGTEPPQNVANYLPIEATQ